MSSLNPSVEPIALPSLPARHGDFIRYIADNSRTSVHNLLKPYKEYDAKLRHLYAQQPDHPAVSEPHMVPVFGGHEQALQIRARTLATETTDERERYVMPLSKEDRRADGAPAIVQSLKEFQRNFAVFSESSLSEMDWSNVVVCGSAALTPLLPVPDKFARTKRGLRKYYHELKAPASDADLFLYGLTEEQAKEKVAKIEQHVRDSVLTETTTVRTKNAITIVSEYPTRHAQVVLRIYRSISEILTGFDVDCSCFAYDGSQIWASPRALAACMTQINEIDLSRRSPSYENRLAKYSRRGFEVYWPALERSRVNPTIYERSFQRVVGLARLMVLEKLPGKDDREAYTNQRRRERGRPALNSHSARQWQTRGDIKGEHEYEIADWAFEEDISDYHTFTIPYGPKYHARKIEKILYKKDLLLNAEWNKSKDREVDLHRHPAFFGKAKDIMQDCCGYCPQPITPEEKEVAEVESKRFVSGDITFLKDDPGRQAIGSFHPITDTDWTEMAYVGNSESLCQAIIDHDLETVQTLLDQEGYNPNQRDWTGRTPFHLAVISSTPEIVQCLIDRGARIVARLTDGKTALHLAAVRGSVDMVFALLRKSEANKELEAKEEQRGIQARKVKSSVGTTHDNAIETDPDIEVIDAPETDDHMETTTEHSIVKVSSFKNDTDVELPEEAEENEPDIYDVDVCAWDVPASALHLAIVNGHFDVVKLLVNDFGANVLIPVKLTNQSRSATASILPLVLALALPHEEAKHMAEVLLGLGASPAQADAQSVTALHYFATEGVEFLNTLLSLDSPGASRALNHMSLTGTTWSPKTATPLTSAIIKGDEVTAIRLLEAGARPDIDLNAYLRASSQTFDTATREMFEKSYRHLHSPLMVAVEHELPSLVLPLIRKGADINATSSWEQGFGSRAVTAGTSTLDSIRNKIESLQQYLNPNNDSRINEQESPVFPEDADRSLNGLSPGSYAYWSIQRQLQNARLFFEKRQENYGRRHQLSGRREQPSAEKELAVRALCREYQELEKELIDRGAKTFLELRPETKEEPVTYQRTPHQAPDKGKQWSAGISFTTSDAAGEREAIYRLLFEACWTGNVDTINRLTTTVWDGTNAPLKAGVVDCNGYSTFDIALHRGNFEAAKLIMEIAQTQHDFKHQVRNERYKTRAAGNDDDEDSGSENESDDGINILTEDVDDQFTVDDVGVVPSRAEGDVSPQALLTRGVPVAYFDTSLDHLVKEAAKRCMCAYSHAEKYRGPLNYSGSVWDGDRCVNLPLNHIQFALHKDDEKLLSFLLDLSFSYAHKDADTEQNHARHLPLPVNDFTYAIQLGRTHLLGEIIRRTGAGLPLESLMKTAKAKIDFGPKPKYYRGLSIHGKKRDDWAQAGRDVYGTQSYSFEAPLLQAAGVSSLESLKWFLSEEPKRCYFAYASANKGDPQLESLARTSGGVENTISAWLSRDRRLLAHSTIQANGCSNPEALEILRYIVERDPSLIDQKGYDGMTPLQGLIESCAAEKDAVLDRKIAMMEVLLKAGADQSTRDKEGKNILHSLVSRSDCDPGIPSSRYRQILELIDPEILPGLFVQKSSQYPGSVTPLASLLHSWSPLVDAELVEIVSTLLSFSNGVELETVNGEGDTPVHTEARRSRAEIVQVMLSYRPETLWRENAVGRTPYEVAKDGYVSYLLSSPPSVPGVERESRGPHRSKTLILGRDPSSFTDEGSPPTVAIEGNSDEEKVWNVCKLFDQREDLPKKRKLVSLLEANEVAKRLATEKSKGKLRGDEDGDEDDDVV